MTSQLSLLDPPPPAPVPAPVKRRRRRRIAESTIEAGKARPAERRTKDDDRCLEEVKRAGLVGRTRKELSRMLAIEIQTVCWCVQRLLDLTLVYEPEVSRDNAGRPVHRLRDRSKVLLSTLYRKEP